MLVRRSTIALFLAFLAFVACGGDTPETPTVVATPTPTPSPTAPPTPSIKSCTVPEMEDCGRFQGCCTKGGNIAWETEIEQSMAELEKRHPDWFHEDGSIDVEEVEYTAELAKIITEMHGICAKGGGIRVGSISRDEVGMKSDNNRSQNVDVLIGVSSSIGGSVPGIVGVYVCRPASF
jgi:hypothetical protein